MKSQSEFSGCASALGGAFTINPYDVDEIAEKCRQNIKGDIILKSKENAKIEQILNTFKLGIQLLSELKNILKNFLTFLRKKFSPKNFS